MNDPEICICAAIKVGEMVIRGHRHDSCYHTAGLIPSLTRDQIIRGEQGFVTSRNRFVGRKEARQLQTAAGIPSVATGDFRGDILFSEDLY